MKYFVTFLLFFSIYLNLSAQKVTDVSPDGSQVRTYNITNNGQGHILKLSQDVPYGIQPTWSGKRDRQIAGIAFADYDKDGDLDLSIGCYTSQSYPPITEYEKMIFRNDNGVLDTLPAWISGDVRSANDIIWGDVNNDGFIDLLSANGSFHKSVVYFGTANGLNTQPGWVSSDNNWTVGAAFCDVDGDGDLDVAFGNQGLSPLPYRPINIFKNNNGVLETVPSWISSDEMITNSVAFADIDNSNLVSVNAQFTANGSTNAFTLFKIPVYKIDSVKVNGIRTSAFTADPVMGWVSLASKPTNGSAVNIYYRYMPKADMGTAKWVNFQSGIYFNNNGVINTSPGWINGITAGLKGVAWADIDLDGYLDLAIGGNSTPNYIWKNNAGVLGTTPYWQSSSSSTSVQEIKFSDVNKDGYPDLAVVHFGYSKVEIFVNRGGVLDVTPTWSYSTGTSSTSIAFGDVNGDSWPDLAIGTARRPIMLFMSDPSLVIPVELVSFNAAVSGKEVKLNWVTSSEKNNKGFDIERRCLDKQANWEKIDYIKGNGTSLEQHSYAYTDFPSSNGKYQYRLKQIDFDGTENYHKPVEVNYISELEFVLDQNYPNPFNPSTSINYSIPFAGYVNIKIYDILGVEVASLVNESKAKGNYNIEFYSGSLSSGIYFYSINFTDASGKTFGEVKKMNLLK